MTLTEVAMCAGAISGFVAFIAAMLGIVMRSWPYDRRTFHLAFAILVAVMIK